MTDKITLRADDINPLTGRPYAVDAALREAFRQANGEEPPPPGPAGATPAPVLDTPLTGTLSSYKAKVNADLAKAATPAAPALADANKAPVVVHAGPATPLGVTAPAAASPPSSSSTDTSDSEPEPPTPESKFKPAGLWALTMLQQMFPQHQFTPVDYNPFKVMPKLGGQSGEA